MNIKHTDLVLEVGSGDNPNPRADILCDRYITSDHERAGGFRIRIDRPVVVADGIRLPFADKTFDYVIASHIFEHMDDPTGFARELMRVGKAGYIEVPSAFSERVFGWGFHHWYCDLAGGTLTLTPKTEGEQWDGFFHKLIARELWFRRWFEEHEDAWYVRVEWNGNIPIRMKTRSVRGDEWELLATAKPEIVKDMLFAVRFFFRRVVRKARKTVRMMIWQFFPSYAWMNRLICVMCRGQLRREDRTLVCNNCKTNYPIDGRIPILLLPEERKNGY